MVPKRGVKRIPSLVVNRLARNLFKIRQYGKRELLHHQETFLFDLIRKCRNTVFGQRYNFKNIKSIQDFQNNVPIFTYKEFKPRVEYMLRGEKNITYPGKIPLFAVSSGTTGKEGKYIPLTNEHLKTSQMRGGEKLLARYCKANPKTRLFAGKTIVIGGTFIKNPYTDKNNVGYITAILQKKSPRIGKLFKRPGLKTSFIENWEEKSNKIIEENVSQNITGITGQPSWCTQFLYKVLEKTGAKNIHEIRPNLEVFLGGGMPVDLYRDSLKELFPDPKFKYRQSYNASEGFFAIQTHNDSDEMLLLTDNGVFYEFIPKEEFGKEDPQVLTLGGVEKNKEYILLITTNAGLRRYIIGDTIRFTEIEPFYKIKITGRTKYYIDVVGEGTTVEYTDKAIIEACKIAGGIATDYTVGPIAPKGLEKGAYERIIEFGQKPKDLQEFTRILDIEMQKAFSNYDDERNYNNTLKENVVHAVEVGTFQKRLSSNNKVVGQSKVPKLMNNRTILDDILENIIQ
ncbi:MAG TPA: GH3 auxin-responsive promoter family protein [Candidatus Absconditabacterales bacterium]|nr:GH3 auxin-responsive promoter family protein [Candidatus Absconditabacterales bacterium]